MNLIKNNQRENLFKKGVFTVCSCAVFAFLQAPYLSAIPGKGDIEINEPKEKPRKISSNSKRACESESECGGCFTKVKAPGVDVEVKAEKAGMKVKI